MFINDYGIRFVVSRSNAPWPVELLSQERKYDCFVINMRNSLSEEQIGFVVTKLARSPCLWIETFGFDAERIHDAIDDEAVAIGRQSKVGDGNPMTSWNDESMTENEFASYALTGGQGDSEWKLILIIGEEDAERRISAAIESKALHSLPTPRN